MLSKNLKIIIGGVIAIGFTNTVYAQDTLWSRTYGFTGSGQNDIGMCGTVTSDSGYIIGGVSYSFAGLMAECWLVKTDSTGDTLWTRTYGGPGFEEAHHIIQTNDGGYAVCGQSRLSGADNYDMYVIRIDPLGETLWTGRYGSSYADDKGYAIVETGNEGYVATGTSYGDIFIIRLDSSGDTVWTKSYGGPFPDYAYGIASVSASGFVITGSYALDGLGTTELWLLRINSLGDTLWTRKYRYNNGACKGEEIIVMENGDFVIGGQDWISVSDVQVLILRTDSLGNELWHVEYGGSGLENAQSIASTHDGGFVTAGIIGDFVYKDFYIVRVDSTGDSLWTAVYGGAGNENCWEVRVTHDGNIMAYGYTTVGDIDYWLLKINDGAIVFPGFLAGLVTGDDLSPVENVIVSVYDSNDSLMGTDSTDSNGEFFFELYPDTYYAEFSKEYYNDTTLTDINIIASETTAVNMILCFNRYEYMVGDVNMYGGVYPPRVIGSDVTYLVNYFRSMPSSQPCNLNGFWASADVSGDCMIIGNDITTLVNYFRGYVTLLYCDEYPPVDSLPATAPQGWPNCGASDPDRVIELINRSMSKILKSE